MHWSEPAYVVSFRAHGERDAVVSVLTQNEGRCVGLVRAGQASKIKPQWQPGCLVKAQWRARLPEHLGSLSGEVVRDTGAAVLHSPLGLAAHLSALHLIDSAVPERLPLPALYEAVADLLPLDDDVPALARYVRFECTLLRILGYGLDLARCAITGQHENLAYVSPRTGRAASRDAAAPWADKLLSLPPFLLDEGAMGWDDIQAGLRLSGHFIEQNLFHVLSVPARQQLIQRRTRLLDLVERERMVSATATRAVS